MLYTKIKEGLMRIILRFLVICIFTLVSLVVYNHFYSIDMDLNVAEKMSEKLNQRVEITQSYDLLEDKMVRFNFSDKTGHAILTKGYNGRYRIGDIFQETYNGPVYFLQYKDYLVIESQENAIQHVDITTRVEPISFDVNGDGFLKIIETDLGKAGLVSYELVSKDNRINQELDYRSKHVFDQEGYINGGPESIVLVTCVGIIIIGIIVSFLFTKKMNGLERLYYKITKTHAHSEENDPNDYSMFI